MQLLMNVNHESKQHSQASFPYKLDYHAPKGRYKIIHQAIIIPNLDAPFHYLNFISFMGQPNIPILHNPYAIQTDVLDTVSTMCSTSPHMVGQFQHYSAREDCLFKSIDERSIFKFGDKEQLEGTIPHFHLSRQDNELSVELDIELKPVISQFSKIKLGLFDHWSVLCQCTGNLNYKGQNYSIHQLGSFEFVRAVNLPYVPFNYYSYQVINLTEQRQLKLIQIRNGFNQIVLSRIYLKDLKNNLSRVFDHHVYFKVHRVYPKVTTPNHQEMYLPREFEWLYEDDNTKIRVKGESRGDYKFGLAAGYAGSFSYQVTLNEIEEEGQSGYCEYVDCRQLRWQEKNEKEKNPINLMEIVPCTLKK